MTAVVEYAFIPGTVSRGVSARDAAHELERIRKARGLTGDAVVEESASASAPLHPFFEWDDAIAGHKYRVRQAQGLIRAVVVKKATQEPRRVYVNVVADDGDRRYERMERAAARPSVKMTALVHLRQNVRSAQNSLDEFYRVCEMGDDEEAIAHLAIASQAMADLRTAVDAIQ